MADAKASILMGATFVVFSIAVGQAKDAERSGDLAGARKALEEAVRNDPQNVWARYDLAQVYLKTEAPGKARQTIDDLLKAIGYEAWLFENKPALASVKRGLAQSAAGRTKKRGSFAAHANED